MQVVLQHKVWSKMKGRRAARRCQKKGVGLLDSVVDVGDMFKHWVGMSNRGQAKGTGAPG
jgi:hypothetical protein